MARRKIKKQVPAAPVMFGRTTWPVYLIGLFCLALSFASVLYDAKDIRAIYSLDAKHWRTSQGTIISSTVHTYLAGTSTRSYRVFEPRVSYTYQVMGNKFTGNVITFNYETFSANQQWIAEAISRKYAVGKQVPVYYLPAEPDFCALEPLNKNYLALGIPILLALVGISFFVLAGVEDLRLQNNSQKLSKKRKSIK